MGEHEGWSEARPPTRGLLLNGLLANEAASAIPQLDKDRWAEAEERTANLIACIQPNQPSEDRRTAVADYVQRLIMKCFTCQVFKFGSVPLKTYLPDGDIDLTAFSKIQNLKETWAHQVRDMLENEEKNENAEFRVKEVQYIQAEVKIIKCLVENIVVDISFNQLGGLCTLCFLEEVDHLINHSHLFKRSIILIKAWCYYESRILGAHHGLISTYALETLVLYIFHVFNNSFLGPLEVLYRFLEFFSKFDWDNYCVSLWGPVPISSLPDVTAQPPRKDGGDILLSKLFLHACSTVYAVLPTGQENQGQPFVSKHFNVIDPLRVNNNLGRSVSKGNFFRIRSAFAFGAKKLARLLDCPKEDLYFELNQFFMNTWERHGSGHRPDAPRNDLWCLRLSDPDSSHGSENGRSSLNNKTTGCDDRVEMVRGSHNITSQHGNCLTESLSRSSEFQTGPRTQNEKTYVNSSSMRIFDQTRKEIGTNQGTHTDKSQQSSKLDNLAGDLQGRYLFARTRSSPELTDTYREVSFQGRRSRIAESGKGQSSARLDGRRKNQDSDNFSSHVIRSSNADPSPVRHASSRQVPDVSVDSNNISNSFHDDANMAAMSEEFVSLMGTQGMHQEQQDYDNSVVASAGIGFNGQVHVPLNLASSHILPFSPSVLASMGYGQRNLGGVIPSNFPLMETNWGTNVQFPPGFVSSPLAHYFQGMGLTSNPEDSVAVHENFGSVELNQGEADQDFWHEHERGSSGGLDNDSGSFESHQSDDKQQSISAGYKSVSSSSRGQQKFGKETRGPAREDQFDTFSHEEGRDNELFFDERVVNSRSFPAAHGSSLKSRTSSESSWEGSSAKVSKPIREKRGRKTATPSTQPPVYGKGKSVSDNSSNQADDDNREWNATSNVGAEMIERNIGSQAAASLHAPPHEIPGFEPTQSSGSESLMPFGPVLLGPGSRQRTTDNSGVLAFYPTGPPVPFVTMVPFYNFSPETGTSDASTSQFSGEEGLDNSDTSQNFDSSEGHDQSEGNAHNSIQRVAAVEPMEHKSDILNSDFASHWQNLQYGRLCQNSHYPTPLSHHSPVMVPPMYLQGRFPLDGPGRPSNNMNVFTQLMSYGPRIVPFAPIQSVSNRPTGVYQHYLDEMPRYRGGTGTYLPNPKVSFRDRHSSNTRKGNYNYDRNDHHGDREWNSNPKSRATGRSHSRSQVEKPSSRLDRLATSENRADRPWSSHRHDAFPSYQSQNGPNRSSSAQSGSANVAYSMYQFQSMNPGGVTSNGPTLPPVVMLYPYDNNVGYGPPTELEFGSLGPVGFSGTNDMSRLNDGSRPGGVFEDQRFHGSSTQRSSPDQPSSPHPKRERNFIA